MFENLTDQTRIEMAKAKMKRLVGHLVYLIALHENNAFIVYSKTLSAQIPKSYAAHAFNLFREAMHQIEIVRMCAVWDKPGEDRDNIPTVTSLIDRDSIIDALAEETRVYYANMPPHLFDLPDDPAERAFQIEAVKRVNDKFGEEQATKARVALREAIAGTDAILNSQRLQSVRTMRDSELAHVLSPREKKLEIEVERAKFHDETKLLEASIPIVEQLYCWVNGISFSLNESRQIHGGYAKALWNTCTFRVER